jgi:hypothetical protein
VIAGTREYCNNQFIIEEDFLKRINWKWYDVNNNSIISGFSEDNPYEDFIKKYMPRLILTTTFQKIIKIDGNIIDMPNLYGVGGDPMCEQFVFTNNNIKLRYVAKSLIDIGNFKQTSNPELSQDREFIINNNIFDIAETYASFTIQDEIT